MIILQGGLTPWQLAEKRANETSMIDFKDRGGVLYSLYAVGAEGSYYPTENEQQDKEFRKIKKAQTAQQR